MSGYTAVLVGGSDFYKTSDRLYRFVDAKSSAVFSGVYFLASDAAFFYKDKSHRAYGLAKGDSSSRCEYHYAELMGGSFLLYQSGVYDTVD